MDRQSRSNLWQLRRAAISHLRLNLLSLGAWILLTILSPAIALGALGGSVIFLLVAGRYLPDPMRSSMPRIILTPVLVLAWVGAIISEPEGGTLLPVILVPGAIRRVDFYPAHGIFNVTLRSGQVLGILAYGETYKLITPFSEKEWSQNTGSLGEMALAMRMTKKASQTASGQPG